MTAGTFRWHVAIQVVGASVAVAASWASVRSVSAGAVAGAIAVGLALAWLFAPYRTLQAPWRVTRRGWAVVGAVTLLAAVEEILWRGVLQANLTTPLGSGGALVVAAVLFSALHIPAQGAAAFPVHWLTGAAFGSAFLVGGVVTAAIAHAVYNVGVALSAARGTDWMQADG
jgi:membrane protease YdiL (CAAX protease family)